jgi:oxygen-independent coproporphyrinogen-3 oxidase
MPLGIYISVPFCRTKCSYCNFASDVFSRAVFERYVDRVCEDIENAPQIAAQMGGKIDSAVDSIYLGGGTPTLLDTVQLQRIFATVRQRFDVTAEAEITIECAPGTLSTSVFDCLLRCGVNRVSLGVQSFVDQEAAAVGRLHKRTTVLDDIAQLRAAAVTNINLDLIAGLPHQTAESWELSLAEVIATGAPHVSVYMLEVDDDSRLGRELLAGGTRYHAHFVPDEESIASFYVAACERLQAAGIAQYEISNFSRAGFESRHNLKYWKRQPYFGFGVDAHSMLTANREPVGYPPGHDHEEEQSGAADYDRDRHDFSRANLTREKARDLSPCGKTLEAVRFAYPDSPEQYINSVALQRTPVLHSAALEECFFLGLRLNHGVNLRKLASQFGEYAVEYAGSTIADCLEAGLMDQHGDFVSLTPRGRLISNEVFERFICADEVTR